MISYEDLCILKLTGILEPYNKKEFIIPEEMMRSYAGSLCTCEFLGCDGKYIIREYWYSGQVFKEIGYKRNIRCGKTSLITPHGEVYYENEYPDVDEEKSLK